MSTPADSDLLVKRFVDDTVAQFCVSADNPDTQLAVKAAQDALQCATPKAFTPSSVPLVSAFDDMTDSTLVDNHKATLKRLPWTPSFRSDDEGHDMALCAFNDVLDLGQVRLGLVLVRATCAYPEHEHPPQEAYFVLSGTATWRFGGNKTYQPMKPGQSFYNHPMDRHGVRADTSPVLAMYALWPG